MFSCSQCIQLLPNSDECSYDNDDSDKSKTTSSAPKMSRRTMVHKLYDRRSSTTTNSSKSVAPFPYDNEHQL